MSRLLEDLTAARDILVERGWHKGGGVSRDGRVCVEEASALATMGHASLWAVRLSDLRTQYIWHGDDGRPLVLDAYAVSRHEAVLGALRLLLPRVFRNHDGTELDVWKWNDRYALNAEDARDLIQLAIDRRTP